MIKVEGFEMWGCPFTIVFSTNDLVKAEQQFYENYPKAADDLFQRIIDKFGYEKNEDLFEIG